MGKSELMAAFQDTLAKSLAPDMKAATEQASKSSKVYPENYHSDKARKKLPGSVIVEENTTFAAAKKYLAEGKTAVLNFANLVTPGGGVQNGAVAQEECLCRSSNLYACLTSSAFADYYRYNRELHNYFGSDRLIYTEGVTVFKDDAAVPTLMPAQEWFQVDVITCAAPYIAKRRYTNLTALKALFKGRIRNIFEVAAEHDIEVLILGAFGCGAFKNPPDVVAQAFKEVIDENQYEDRFEKIVFAIKSTVSKESPQECPNIRAFRAAFAGVSVDLNRLRFIDSCAIAEVTGSVPLPSGKTLKGGDQFNPYLDWVFKNKYFGKQFSILGDSISTLEGYNPNGYNIFYTQDACNRTGVRDMQDTWWGKVIEFFGAELLINNSWSGSRVTQLPGKDTLFPSGCSDQRTSGLHIGTVMPDVIIVYMGFNDWSYGAQVEEERIGFQDETIFSAAYAKMLDKLRRNYPAAEIFCCTLNETYMASNPAFEFPHSHGGVHIERYNNVIRYTASKYNCTVIDLYNSYLPYDAVDGSHPTEAGMNTLSTLILHSLCDQEGLSFLECGCAKHEFIAAEEYTGGTKYVCRKCGLVDHWNMLDSSAFEKRYTGSTVNGNRVGSNIAAQADSDIIDLDPDRTAIRYSSDMGIQLFSVSSGKEVTVYKTKFHAGRDSKCDLRLSSKFIARIQARFLFDGTNWLILDNSSTNGTWLNDTKLIPGRKYVLHPDDMIDFAHTEKFVFFKTNQQNLGHEETQAIALLEAVIKAFHDSDHNDATSFWYIMNALINAPLYLAVTIDTESILGSADPTKLKPGDVLQPSKDVRIKVQTIIVNNTEFIPMFTSAEEVNKGPSVSTMRMHPQDYLPKIRQMGKNVVLTRSAAQLLYSPKR